jgi:hypothetical protein
MGGALVGRCLCGAVRITVAGAHDLRPGACHCRMCQRWSGGLFLCFEADAAGVTVDGPAVRFASSDFAERAFCGVCGSHLWMRNTGGASYDLMPGLFDAAQDWPLHRPLASIPRNRQWIRPQPLPARTTGSGPPRAQSDRPPGRRRSSRGA